MGVGDLLFLCSGEEGGGRDGRFRWRWRLMWGWVGLGLVLGSAFGEGWMGMEEDGFSSCLDEGLKIYLI